MENPRIDLYATEEIGGGLGNGLRIIRSDDTIYEARRSQRGHSRIYEEDGTWHAKVRFPVDDREGVYDRMRDMMDDLNQAYDTALDSNPKAFGDAVNRSGAFTVRDGDTTLRYVEEEDVDDEEHVVANASRAAALKGWITGTSATVGSSAGVGALAGGALGMLAGPPGAVGGALAGAEIGGVGGGVVAFMETADTIITRGGDYPSDAPLMGRAIRYFDARERTKYHPDLLEAAANHFERINTLRSLERELEERERYDEALHDELEALRDKDLETIHDTVMDAHFTGFEDGEGLTATHDTDTYLDAARFVGHVTNHVPPTEQPSLHTSPDAFQQIFDHLTYEENGEHHYLPDAHTLVATLYDADNADADIVAWLEDEHAELVQDVGQEHAMG